MERFIKKEGLRYDIFHSHYWDAGYVAMKLTQRFNYFFVHTFHSTGAWKRDHMGGDPRKMEKRYRFKERIKTEKTLFKKAYSLVMTSLDMVKTSAGYYDYTGNNHIVIPAGVNTEIYHPIKGKIRERQIDVPQNYIFWVGRFANNKGLDYLLNAFAEIVRKDKDLFLIIGGGSKNPKPREKQLRQELTKILNKKQLNNRVFFTGHIPDKLMPTYYRKSKLFVLPSKFEPFGMTAAEAMACGIPLVVSKRAGITKFLTHRKNCLVVNPANKKELSSAFHLLNKNRSLHKKLSRNGLKTAHTQFSWDHIADLSVTYYNKLLISQP